MVDAAAATLQPGSVFAERFRVGEEIGRGGYGVVYRAFDQGTRHEVALKVLRSDRADPISVRRFQREATLGRELDSPHLVRIFDTGTSGDLAYLVLEYLPGGTLRDRIAQGPQAIEAVLALAVDLTRGLAALHARGLVHRDVKPSNVLFDERGRAKLADFGLVSWRQGELTLSIAETGLIGTATYLSPEQALGKPVGPQSDLFSLGAVLFEALSGRSPFPTESVAAVLARIAQPAPRLRSVVPNVPRWLDSLVARLLEREPADRYATATELLADLERQRLGPRRLSVSGAISTVARRAHASVLIAISLLVAAAAGLWIWSRSDQRFDHFRWDSAAQHGSVQGIDRRGRVLWERHDTAAFHPRAATLARLDSSTPPAIVTSVHARSDGTPAAYGTLSVLDAQSGQLIRQVPLHMPENMERTLQGLPERYFLHSIHAIDLNQDGIDEVIASFVHATDSPSFTVLWEPALDRARSLFLAGGHMALAAVTDLDADGSPELLFTGYNGMLCGRYPAIAALRLTIPVGSLPLRVSSALGGAALPGLGQLERGRTYATTSGLAWFRLLPRGDIWYGQLGDDRLALDPVTHRLRLRYDDIDTELELDGGAPEDRVQPPAAAAARLDAYTAIERARRLAGLGDWAGAVSATQDARGLATRVADPPLAECAARVQAEMLLGDRRLEEADRLYTALASGEEAASEIAYTAAAAYHAAGELARAIDWYRRGLGPAGGNREGSRQRIYFLEGLVLALGELGRWDQAEAEARRYGASFNDPQRAAVFAAYCRLRRGLAPGTEAGRPRAVDLGIDTLRYLALELELADQGPSAELLERAQRELGNAYETRGAVRSLVALVLAALGRQTEALDAARQGVEELEALSRSSPVAHAFLAVAVARSAELERGAAAHPISGAAPVARH